MMLGFSDKGFSVGSWVYIDHGSEVYARQKSFNVMDGEVKKVEVTRIKSNSQLGSEKNSMISNNTGIPLVGKSMESGGIGMNQSLGKFGNLGKSPVKVRKRVSLEESIEEERMNTQVTNQVSSNLKIIKSISNNP